MQYSEEKTPPGCFFCHAATAADPDASLTIARDPHAVTKLNKIPYGHGHLLVAPIRHVALPDDLDDTEYDGLQRALRR